MEELVRMNAAADEQTAVRYGRPGGRSRRPRGARWLAGVVAAALVAAALPAVAGATDYCVDATAACGPKNVASFEQALDQADNTADADRVFLGADIYTAPDEGGFKYYQASGPVEIIGQGAGQTILTNPGPGNDGAIVNLFGGAGTSIHDLTIRLPQDANMTGLMTTNTARRIEIVEDPTQTHNRAGAELEYGGTLEDSTVTLGTAQGSVAVGLGMGGGTVRRSVLSARVGVSGDYGGTIERSRVTGSEGAVFAYRNVTAITASLVRFSESGGYGIFAVTRAGFQTVVNADGVTIAGPGLPGTGAGVGTDPAPAESADINLTNSIIRGVSIPLFADAWGTGQAKVAASYSDYDQGGPEGTSGTSSSITEANVSNVGDAGFVDAATGDYRLLPGSPLVDAGDPAAAQGLDLGGNPLVADGNGDGTARRDLGAFELPGTDGGQQGGAGGQPATPPAADTQAPLISGFRSTRSAFAVARAATPRAARAKRGTSLRYTLSENARVALKIQRKGRTRYRSVGTLRRAGAKGASRIRFSGRIGRRALRPGRYRIVATAVDAAGNRSAPKVARLRILR
jgi:hypothetical protein